jgi:hypothetical protein
VETDQITVTEDGRRIVGWEDGATVARIIWKHEEHGEHVHGREVDNEGTPVAVLYAVDNSRYQLVSAELVSAVTLGDLVAAIAPGYRDVVLVETDLKTQRCTCADEVLYKVTVNSPNGSTVMSSLTSSLVPSVTDFQRKQDSSAEITVEQHPNPRVSARVPA